MTGILWNRHTVLEAMCRTTGNPRRYRSSFRANVGAMGIIRRNGNLEGSGSDLLRTRAASINQGDLLANRSQPRRSVGLAKKVEQ